MYKWLHTVLCIFAVTPHAGVRIEMRYAPQNGQHRAVTPHAGVRIEITIWNEYAIESASPPTRGCELKFAQKYSHTDLVVTPHAGVRIEIRL